MEVVHRRREEEVMVEQLLPRRRRAHLGDDDGSESSDDVMNGISDEKSVYFDDKQDTKLQWSENKVMSAEDEEKISKLVNAVINHQNMEGEILSVSTANNIISEKFGAKENLRIQEVEETDDDDEEDDEIELEFERAVEKVHTHTPYCPNCRNTITKVILRRKKRTVKPQLDLFGCFRCFAVFLPSGDCLNPLRLVGSNVEEGEQPSVPTTNAQGQGHRRWSLYYNLFGSKPNVENPEIEDENSNKPPTHAGSAAAAGQPKPLHQPLLTRDIEAGPADTEGGGPTVNINVGEQPTIPAVIIQRSRSLEILKCIVYGGLMESIASLSIVSSAAASDAATLNVVAIGFATVFSGLILFFSNLVELRNENSKGKYEQVLGKKGHFGFHSTFALLSYLVFGLIAPTTYGFAFRESDDKDYKILAVAAAAFGSVFLLSIAKAYVKGTEGLGGYVKTILCYVTLAVSASGVAYAAGHLFGILLNNLGLFQETAASSSASY